MSETSCSRPRVSREQAAGGLIDMNCTSLAPRGPEEGCGSRGQLADEIKHYLTLKLLLGDKIPLCLKV